MKLIGIMPVRNEAWCLGLSARVALGWCDELVILDHASTDTSRWIIDAIASENYAADRITRLVASDPQWDEMLHREMMLMVARKTGATHIAIIDADEILTANLLPIIRDVVIAMPRGYMMQLPGYNLRGSLDRYHANGIWGSRWFSLCFQDSPELHWGGDTFHAREPQGMKFRAYQPIAQGAGGVLHLWGVSERRLIARHALYKVIERLRWPDKPVEEIDGMYSWAIRGDPTNRSYGTPDRWAYSDVPAAWWGQYREQWGKYLDIDAEPWQEAEVKRLIAEYGPEPFSRLDLFGVA